MHVTNRIRALAVNMLQNVVRQETMRIHVPSPSFQNAKKNQTSKKKIYNGMCHDCVRQETAEIHVPSSGLKTQKNRKTSKNAFHEWDPSAHCQNEGPKNELDECTVRFAAAQFPPGSIDASAACRPDSLRSRGPKGRVADRACSASPRPSSAWRGQNVVV